MQISNHILANKQEIITYDIPGIPIHTETRRISEYNNMRSILHWHEDLELMRVISGELYYCSERNRTLLHTNDSILVNSRRLHYYTSVGQQDCTFHCVTLNPQLLTGNPMMRELYIDPVLDNIEYREFFFPKTHRMHSQVAEISDNIMEAALHQEYGYPLSILSQFEWLFYEVIRVYNLFHGSEVLTPDRSALQMMTHYILMNYMEKISVDDIAAAGSVSRSKCYHLFNEFEQQTPLDYLKDVRLKTAQGLLRDSKLKIIDISDACGFSYCNYFTQTFKKKYGVTPLGYRKRITEQAEVF